MYNGSHSDGVSSSGGSFYSARPLNVLTSTDTITAKDFPYNICAKNWTLPTEVQTRAIAGTAYYSVFATAHVGAFRDSQQRWIGHAYWWSRTGYNASSFYDYYSAGTGSIGASTGRYQQAHTGNSARCLVK